MAPQNVARGAPQSGDRAAAGMPGRAKVHVGASANSPLRGRIFVWKALLRPSRSRPILPQPGWDGGFAGGLLCQAPGEGDQPIRVVAFRASHPAKPPSRQRRLVQGCLNL